VVRLVNNLLLASSEQVALSNNRGGEKIPFRSPARGLDFDYSTPR